MVALVVLIGVAVALLLLPLARRSGASDAPSGSGRMEDPVAAALRRAVAAGQITAEQAEMVLASEATLAVAVGEQRRPARVPPVLEALGYLGAILVIVGAVTLVSGFWDDLATWSRLGILGLAAAVLTGVGLAVRDEREPVLWRLRGFVLLLGSGALAGFTGLLGADALEWRSEAVALLAGSAVAAHSGLLWGLRDRPAQHLACLGGLVAVAVGAVTWAGGEQGAVGVTLWALGAAWAAGAFRRRLPPAFLGKVVGAVLALAGAGVTGAQWNDFGVLFGLATAAAMVAGGIRTNEFLITAAGVIGTFFYLPATVGEFFGDTIGVPAVMLVSGLALLGLMVRMVQRRGRTAAPPRSHWPARPGHAA